MKMENPSFQNLPRTIQPRLSNLRLGITSNPISVSREYSTYSIAHICTSGFVSGRKKAIVPWAKVKANPSAWILPECYPSSFMWGDPSHMTTDNVLLLLNHWTKREKAGQIPLIWNPSCELLADVGPQPTRVWNVRSRTQIQRDPSPNADAEEDFRAELAAISETNMNTDCLPSPASVPDPDPTHPEDLDDEILRPPSFNRHSPVRHDLCKSDIT